MTPDAPRTEAVVRVLTDVLCRASFGKMTEDDMARVAAQQVRALKLHGRLEPVQSGTTGATAKDPPPVGVGTPAATPDGSSFRGNADPADSLDALRAARAKIEALTSWPRVSMFAYDAQVRGVPVNPTEDRVVIDRDATLAIIDAALRAGQRSPRNDEPEPQS